MPDDSLIILEPAIADNSSAKLVLQKYIKEMDTEGRYACYNINILSIKCLALPIGNETSTAYYQTPAQTSTRIWKKNISSATSSQQISDKNSASK